MGTESVILDFVRSRQTMAERLHSRLTEEFHGGNSHNQKSHGGGGGRRKNPEEGGAFDRGTSTAKGIHDQVVANRKARITRAIQDRNLVVGDVKRENMPQIPRSHSDQFKAELREMGVTVKVGTAKTSSLKPTQNEMNQGSIDAIAKKIKSGDWKEGHAPWISNDNYVLDGHHRVFAKKDAGVKSITVVRVDLPMSKLLKLADDFNHQQDGISKRGINDTTSVSLAAAFMEQFHGNHNQKSHGRRGNSGGRLGGDSVSVNQTRNILSGKRSSPAVDLIKAKIKGTNCDPSPCKRSDEANKDADGNYTPERQRLHKKIIDAHFEGVETPPDGDKVLFSMGGGPGSGKGYVQSKGIINPPDKKQAVHINADDIKAMLPEYNKLVKLTDPQAADYVHEESSMLSKAIQARAMSEGKRLVMDQVGSSPEKMIAQMKAAKDLGYRTEAHYVTVDVATAMKRAEDRGVRSGRVVPPSVIKNGHTGATETFQALVKSGTVDKFSLTDNTGSSPNLLADGSGATLKVRDQSGFDVFKTRTG